MTNSRRVVVGIAAAATALALVVIGPAETALGARFPFGFGGLGARQGQHDGADGQDGKNGRSFNPRGQQGAQGDDGGERQLNGQDGEKGDVEDLTRPLSPAQRARLQAREAIARAREQAADF